MEGRNEHGASRYGSRVREIRTSGVEPPRDPAALMLTRDVTYLTGYSRVTLWRWVAAGHFPPPDRLLPGTPHRKAWRRATVDAWLQNQKAAADVTVVHAGEPTTEHA